MLSPQTCAPMPGEFASAGSPRSSPCFQRRSRCTGGLRSSARWKEPPIQAVAFPLSQSSNTWQRQIWLWSSISMGTAERHWGMALTSIWKRGPKKVKQPRLSQAEPKSLTPRRKLKGFRKVPRELPVCSLSTQPARKWKKSGHPAAPDHKKRNRTDRDHLKRISDFLYFILLKTGLQLLTPKRITINKGNSPMPLNITLKLHDHGNWTYNIFPGYIEERLH